MTGHYKERSIGDLKVLEIPGNPEKGMIVILHGFGADAFDLMPLSQACMGPTWLFPQGPLEVPFSPHYVGRAWFPVNIELLSNAMKEQRYQEIAEAFPPEINAAQSLLENFLNQLNVPRSKITLGGFSQGAILAIETTLKSFKKSGALLIFSGTLINELNWKKLAPSHAKTPFFQSHGSHDPLLPMKKAEDLEKLLLSSGLEGKLHTFEGGHEIPQAIFSKLSSFLSQIFGQTML